MLAFKRPGVERNLLATPDRRAGSSTHGATCRAVRALRQPKETPVLVCGHTHDITPAQPLTATV